MFDPFNTVYIEETPEGPTKDRFYLGILIGGILIYLLMEM